MRIRGRKKERSRGAVFGLVSLRSCAPSLSEERERERERERNERKRDDLFFE